MGWKETNSATVSLGEHRWQCPRPGSTGGASCASQATRPEAASFRPLSFWTSKNKTSGPYTLKTGPQVSRAPGETEALSPTSHLSELAAAQQNREALQGPDPPVLSWQEVAQCAQAPSTAEPYHFANVDSQGHNPRGMTDCLMRACLHTGWWKSAANNRTWKTALAPSTHAMRQNARFDMAGTMLAFACVRHKLLRK